MDHDDSAGQHVFIHEVLGPLEHSVLDHAGPAGQHVAVGPVGQLRTLSPSDCHPAGPAGPYVAGGPVGPDGTLKVLEPLEHSVLDHADPAGQHAVIQEVLEPLEHSVLDHADPAGQHAVIQEVLEPLEHSVMDTALDGQPMEGIPVLEPLEHSVLEMTLDGGPLEEMSDWEPLAHSVLNVTLDGRPMEGIPDLEPLEHSVLVMALDSELTEGISHLEPLEHSVLNAALVGRPMEGTPVLELLEHSNLEVALDGGPVDEMSHLEPLEHSVLNTALDSGLTKGDGGPKLGPDCKLTFSKLPHATRNDDLVLGAAVPLPAENVGRVALLPEEVRLGAGDVNTDENITARLQCLNTEGDVLDQYETFNGMPVYYGGDMYDSEDSDWDDPYALASAAYVEDYHFDVPEGMDRMVHRHRRAPINSDIRQNWQTDMTPVCRTMPCDTRYEWYMLDDDSLTEAVAADGLNMNEFYQRVVSSDEVHFVDSDDGCVTDLERDMSDKEDFVDSDDEWNMLDNDSLTEAVAADGPNMNEFYQRVVSSDKEDFVDSDDGSVTDLDRDMLDKEDCVDSDIGSVTDLDRDMSVEADCCDSDVVDLEWDTWADACSFAFRNAVGAFPPEAADIWPAVVFRNHLFSGEELADAVVSVRGDVHMSPGQQLTDMGVAIIPPVTGRPVQRTVNGLVSWDDRMKKVGGSVGQSCF